VANLAATKHEARPLSDPPYKTLPLQANAQLNSTATTVDQLKADFNALLTKLRASGAIQP